MTTQATLVAALTRYFGEADLGVARVAPAENDVARFALVIAHPDGDPTQPAIAEIFGEVTTRGATLVDSRYLLTPLPEWTSRVEATCAALQTALPNVAADASKWAKRGASTQFAPMRAEDAVLAQIKIAQRRQAVAAEQLATLCDILARDAATIKQLCVRGDYALIHDGQITDTANQVDKQARAIMDLRRTLEALQAVQQSVAARRDWDTAEARLAALDAQAETLDEPSGAERAFNRAAWPDLED